MFSFFQDDFAKSEIGHYFCPFFSFPKQSWKNKNTNLYNKWIYLLKDGNNDLNNMCAKREGNSGFFNFFLHGYFMCI